MQKISRYLYPNRIELLADIAEFSVEFTNVYQRNLKIYKGIDNTIEFDIKNADQKRIDLTTFSQIQMNVMDASGNALLSSPYYATATTIKGIATVTIPLDDLIYLTDQYLIYSVTAVNSGTEVMLYSDSRFGAVGTIELIGNAMPTIRDEKIYKTFTSEIDLNGNPIFHSSSIPAKFYEAIPTDILSFQINVIGFVGSIWIEATENDTINVEAFRAAGKPFGSWTRTSQDGLYTGTIPFGSNISVGNYSYFRISYQTSAITGIGATFDISKSNNLYQVTVRNSGTSYMNGSLIKIPGSHVGGIDGINDIIITVNGVEGTGSSYSMGSIGSISWTGTASDGTGTYVVTGVNYSGIVDKVVVS